MDGSHQAPRSVPSGLLNRRLRSEDSWIEIASRPSSSSLSSAADDLDTTDSRMRAANIAQRRRQLRQNAPSGLQDARRALSAGEASSQEEYDESESESDRILSSSNEGPPMMLQQQQQQQAIHPNAGRGLFSAASDDDDHDENRTTINWITQNDKCFTPQPNAFSHPPTAAPGNAPVTDSYFPSQRPRNRPAMATHHSLPIHPDSRRSHMPQNILSPSYDAAAHHEEVLRTSLSTLLSCAAAARGLPRAGSKQAQAPTTTPPRPSNRVEPMSFRLIPASALPTTSTGPSNPTTPPRATLEEPSFKPTLRRESSSSITSTSSRAAPRDPTSERKSTPATTQTSRSRTPERRQAKKARRTHSHANTSTHPDEFITPTLLTWLVSAGVVVVLSALSFRAGYSLGREARKMEGSFGGNGMGFGEGEVGFGGWGSGVSGAGDGAEGLRNCAREAGRQSLGLKRSLARSAVPV